MTLLMTNRMLRLYCLHLLPIVDHPLHCNSLVKPIEVYHIIDMLIIDQISPYQLEIAREQTELLEARIRSPVIMPR